MATETFSGARAIFNLDGVRVGFAGGVSGEEVLRTIVNKKEA